MHGLVAVDLHVIWQQVFHPQSILFRTLWATVYISVASQAIGVFLGLIAALDLGRLRLDLPRHATARPDLLHLLRVQLADAALPLLDRPRRRDRRHHRAEHQR